MSVDTVYELRRLLHAYLEPITLVPTEDHLVAQLTLGRERISLINKDKIKMVAGVAT